MTRSRKSTSARIKGQNAPAIEIDGPHHHELSFNWLWSMITSVQTTFIVLKLGGYFDVSWLWVFTPAWGLPAAI